MKLVDYLEAKYKIEEVEEKLKNRVKNKNSKLTDFFPNASKQPEQKPNSKKHNDYLQTLMNKTMVEKYYKLILNKSSNFDEVKYKKYHAAYNKIANKDSEFVLSLKKLMELKITPDEKWNKYIEFMNKEIQKFNKANILHPHKCIEEIK